MRAILYDIVVACLSCDAQTDKYGSTYEGQYFAGKKEGQGCLAYFNGDKYSGHFFNNKKEGQGRMEDAHGGVYEGQWLNNRREGQGTQTDRNGATYSGQWRDNKRAGQGSMSVSFVAIIMLPLLTCNFAGATTRAS
jgi:hypothetical protein